MSTTARSGARTVCMALLCACGFALPLAAQDAIVAAARAQAIEGRRTEAIASLREYLTSSPADTEARVLLGTVLSWERRFDEARSELQTVLAAEPADGDALAALINVELWSGRPRPAKDVADRALASDPNDSRFIEGRRRALDAIDATLPWRVSLGATFDWFSDDTSWRETQVTVRRATPFGPVLVHGARAARFGLSDNQFELEAYPRLRPGTYLYIAGAVAPDHVLYPRFRYAFDVYQSVGRGFELAGGLRRMRFGDSNTEIYTLAVNKYVADWLLTARMYSVPNRSAGSSTSYHGSVRKYFAGGDGTSYVGGRYSHGFAREEVRDVNDFAVLDADTVAAELNAIIARRVTVNASAAASRQQRLSQRDLRQYTAAVTIGLRF